MNNFQLAKNISKLGMKVRYCLIKGSFIVSKTINMAREYSAELTDSPTVIFDNIRLISLYKQKINSEEVISTVKSSLNSVSNCDNATIKAFVDANKAFINSKFKTSYMFSFLHKEFIIEDSHEFIKLYTELMNSRVGDSVLHSRIIEKMQNIVLEIANDLHLSLTIEKGEMDAKYLAPLRSKIKIDKALKGIYNVSK